MVLKFSMRIIYLFLLIPLGLALTDFFWWFYTERMLTGYNWEDFPRIMFTLCSTYAAGILVAVTEGIA